MTRRGDGATEARRAHNPEDPTRFDSGPRYRARDRYWEAYYRDALGLPDWQERVRSRRFAAPEAAQLAQCGALVGPLRGLRLLDVGAGPGGFVAQAHARGVRAWGVEPDPSALAGRWTDRLVQAEAERLPFRPGSFDIVHCHSALEHVADPAVAIREVVRLLRSGGRCLVGGTIDRRALWEGHYKLAWPAFLPRPLQRLYLRLRGCPTRFLRTVRALSAPEYLRLFARAGARAELVQPLRRRNGGPLVRLYHRVRDIPDPIEIVARRGYLEFDGLG